MRCKVCGHDELVETEYRTKDLLASALECLNCHAINLDEHAARTERELDSVRRAMAARQSAGASESGTHRTMAGSVSAAEVDSALSEIDLRLAEARVALEFLFHVVKDGEAGKAVTDAQRAMESVGRVLDDLGKRCARAIATADVEGREQGTGTLRKKGIAS